LSGTALIPSGTVPHLASKDTKLTPEATNGPLRPPGGSESFRKFLMMTPHQPRPDSVVRAHSGPREHPGQIERDPIPLGTTPPLDAGGTKPPSGVHRHRGGPPM